MNGTCIACNSTEGIYVDEDGECREVCGDGILVGLNECDDNNTLDGDG